LNITATQDTYTIRELAKEAQRQVSIHGSDGAKLLEGLRDPLSKFLERDLSKIGVKREGNHIDESRYLYYDGEMSITLDHLPKGKFIPPHDHGTWEAMAIYSGRLEHTVYDRKDDGGREGYAELEVVDDRTLERNGMAIVSPPREIHSFTALTDDTWSVTVVGGPYKDDRAYYKPETNSYVLRNPKLQKVV